MPNGRFLNWVECLREVVKRDALTDHVFALRDVLGVLHVSYHSVSRTGSEYGAVTYSQAWVDRYVAQEYTRIDPVVAEGLRRVDAFDWKEADWSGRAARTLLSEAQEYGLGRQGMSLSMRGPGGQFALFTLNDCADDDAWARKMETVGSDAILAAYYINQCALRIDQTDTDPARALSPRETDALSLVASGMSRSAAARYLEISEHTLRVYIESARNKLGATNTTHAVARAIAKGLIAL
ncbi:LuxR family transcriptional regulator [Palleronia sediminis]|uniref:LuxR family transcriptional regulator n=1 Tax=Palleronia sediminis TaxID=2547833 RepID=A0A4R6AF48_9RHOB|nr:autoinducer binding domain-containing protein [Palleronia sediminis]TDL81917.1 LuxR family transcriptional regulator [Palleronia sediminis]